MDGCTEGGSLNVPQTAIQYQQALLIPATSIIFKICTTVRAQPTFMISTSLTRPSSSLSVWSSFNIFTATTVFSPLPLTLTKLYTRYCCKNGNGFRNIINSIPLLSSLIQTPLDQSLPSDGPNLWTIPKQGPW